MLVARPRPDILHLPYVAFTFANLFIRKLVNYSLT